MAKSAAERAREYRARQAAERDEKAARERERVTCAAGRETRDSVESAIEAMAKWLTPSDAASVQQARRLAQVIDEAIFSGDVSREMAAHGRLSRVLDQIGGTPTVRMAHELRSLRANGGGGGAGGDEASSGEAGETPPNVTSLQRPPKRSRGA